MKQLRLHRDDFETLKIIGRGAFGEVRFCLRPFNSGSVTVGVVASVPQSHKNVWILCIGGQWFGQHLYYRENKLLLCCYLLNGTY